MNDIPSPLVVPGGPKEPPLTPEQQELFDRHYEYALMCARRKGPGNSLKDREQDALVGLLHAVRKLDPPRGLRFLSAENAAGRQLAPCQCRGVVSLVPRPDERLVILAELPVMP